MDKSLPLLIGSRPAGSLARATALVCALLGVLAPPLAGAAERGDGASVSPLKACAELADGVLAGFRVTAARPVAADGDLPAYCAIEASEIGSEGATTHEVRALLPEAWAQRLYQQGGGGFDGVIKNLLPKQVSAPSAGSAALKSGAIVLGNNGGHRDPSGRALLDHTAAIERYAHRAIGSARDFADALALAYYGGVATRAYYQGCSNGGRGALNAAAKYGDKFDAVIAGAPTLSTAGQAAQWARAAALPVTDQATLDAVAAQAVTACDALDGAVDGIISDWAACAFDPRRDVAASVGLTAASAGALEALIDGVTLADGTRAYSGFGFGNMAGYAAGYPLLGRGYMGYIVLGDGDWTATDFDLERDYPAIVGVLEERYRFSAETAGLARFLRAGKKIMVWHGSNDVVTSHKDTVRSWQRVAAATGPAASANSRLYIAAGVNHCSGGPGADVFDLLTPMMNWVEQGVAPGGITAARFDATAGKPLLTRPLCVHPQVPRYTGQGEVSDAASFVCS